MDIPERLYILASRGDDEELRKVLATEEGQAELNSTYLKSTPITWAAAQNRESTVRLLIASGADVNIHSNNESAETPLFEAAKNNNVEIATMLLDAGAEINATDNFGYTPLILAAMRDSFDVIKVLIDRGADVNRVSIRGSALLEACVKKNKEIAGFLMKRGAKMDEDLTAYHLNRFRDDLIAELGGREEIEAEYHTWLSIRSGRGIKSASKTRERFTHLMAALEFAEL